MEDVLGRMGHAMVWPAHELELEDSPAFSIAFDLKLLDSVLVVGFLTVDESDAEAIAVGACF